jgi:hypothetical protein
MTDSPSYMRRSASHPSSGQDHNRLSRTVSQSRPDNHAPICQDDTPNTTHAVTHRYAGAEPGINPRHNSAFEQYGRIKQKCVIDVIDYSSERITFKRAGNEEFVNMMRGTAVEEEGHGGGREQWASVRWINIGGISWEVIGAVAIKYGLLSYTLSSPALDLMYIPIVRLHNRHPLPCTRRCPPGTRSQSVQSRLLPIPPLPPHPLPLSFSG